jgi:hypothetical protein
MCRAAAAALPRLRRSRRVRLAAAGAAGGAWPPPPGGRPPERGGKERARVLRHMQQEALRQLLHQAAQVVLRRVRRHVPLQPRVWDATSCRSRPSGPRQRRQPPPPRPRSHHVALRHAPPLMMMEGRDSESVASWPASWPVSGLHAAAALAQFLVARRSDQDGGRPNLRAPCTCR